MFAAIRLTAALAALTLPAFANDTDKIRWFQGTFEDALTTAKEGQKRVFVYFWANESKQCQRTYQETMKDARCVKRLADYVCFSAQTTTENGSKLVERFNVKSLPTMLVVESDGKPEDALVGYANATNFITEFDRIKTGFRTVSWARKRAAEEPDNLERRSEYATLLRHVGDFAAADKIVHSIKKDDPDGKTKTGARFKLGDLKQQLLQDHEDLVDADLSPIIAFLKRTKHDELRYEGWAWVGGVEYERGKHKEARKALGIAWQSCTEKQQISFGGELVRVYWKMRESLRTADKKFILGVAKTTIKNAERMKDPKVAKETLGYTFSDGDYRRYLAKQLDSLACCYFMAGKRGDAMKTIERAEKLAPKLAKMWKERIDQFKNGS